MTNQREAAAAALRRRRRRQATKILEHDPAYGVTVREKRGRLTLEWLVSNDPLVALLSVRGAQASLDALMLQSVFRARSEGDSWQLIGSCLGISRQAAQKRYGAIDLVVSGEVSIDDLLRGPDE